MVVSTLLGRRPGRAARRDPTAGELIYAIGDIHGRYDLLVALMEAMAKDWTAEAKGRRPILIFCGDYVDRGPQSAEVVEALLWLQRRPDIQVHLLKGNHEQALVKFLDHPADAGSWIRFGGAETLVSYGVLAPDPEDAASLIRARDMLLQTLPSSHLRLLERLELMLVVGDYAFVHAGIHPGSDLKSQREEDLLWIRQAFLNEEGPFEKIIVHGHSWSDERPQLLEHRIGVDTGAYATGVLTAVRLDGGEMGLVQARGERAASAWAETPQLAAG